MGGRRHCALLFIQVLRLASLRHAGHGVPRLLHECLCTACTCQAQSVRLPPIAKCSRAAPSVANPCTSRTTPSTPPASLVMHLEHLLPLSASRNRSPAAPPAATPHHTTPHHTTPCHAPTPHSNFDALRLPKPAPICPVRPTTCLQLTQQPRQATYRGPLPQPRAQPPVPPRQRPQQQQVGGRRAGICLGPARLAVPKPGQVSGQIRGVGAGKGEGPAP